jgi:hypothetical protein
MYRNLSSCARDRREREELASLRRVDDGAIIDSLNAAWQAQHPAAAPLVTFSVDDDGMLMWLSDRSAAAQQFAETYLLTHSTPANTAGAANGVYSTSVPASGLTKVYTGAAADALVHAAPATRTPPT